MMFLLNFIFCAMFLFLFKTNADVSRKASRLPFDTILFIKRHDSFHLTMINAVAGQGQTWNNTVQTGRCPYFRRQDGMFKELRGAGRNLVKEMAPWRAVAPFVKAKPSVFSYKWKSDPKSVAIEPGFSRLFHCWRMSTWRFVLSRDFLINLKCNIFFLLK